MRKSLILIIVQIAFGLCSINAQNQGLNNMWYQGYSSWAGLPYGGIEIDFISGAPVISYISRPMDLNRTHANISDTLGNMLFYTNGYYIADASNDTMLNGSNISPTSFVNYPYALPVPQACLVISKPSSSNLYYLFHNTLDNPAYNKSHFLYWSVIDMNGNGGLGEVILKNQVIIQDTLNPGKITAVKHANGRDWWVTCQRINSNMIYKILVTPSGISSITSQNEGSIRPLGGGQAYFSPDGTMYANYYLAGGLDLFLFDRCNGTFMHVDFIPTGNYNYLVGGGVAFSPNSKVLYVSDLYEVYQYDLTASNIAASEQLIAVWDSTYSPNPPFATLFENAELAADGKIYLTTGNGTFKMHVINYPDSLGTACDLVQHGVTLPAFYFNTLPNHPNYFLGCDTSSSCNCLTTSIHENNSIVELNCFPNPTTGSVTLKFPVQDEKGVVEIYDVNGKLVQQEYIAPWSQFKRMELSHLNKGIYFCKVRWQNSTGQVKVVIE